MTTECAYCVPIFVSRLFLSSGILIEERSDFQTFFKRTQKAMQAMACM